MFFCISNCNNTLNKQIFFSKCLAFPLIVNMIITIAKCLNIDQLKRPIFYKQNYFTTEHWRTMRIYICSYYFEIWLDNFSNVCVTGGILLLYILLERRKICFVLLHFQTTSDIITSHHQWPFIIQCIFSPVTEMAFTAWPYWFSALHS